MVKRLALGLCLATSLAAPPVSAATTPVPAAFQDLWAGAGKSCRPGADSSQLRFTADRMRYFRVDAPILKLQRRGAREIVLETDFLMGDVYERRTFRFRLSADGRQLTEIGPVGSTVRKRCPKAVP